MWHYGVDYKFSVWGWRLNVLRLGAEIECGTYGVEIKCKDILFKNIDEGASWKT